MFEDILIANNHVTRAVEDGTLKTGCGIEIQLALSNKNRHIVFKNNLISGFSSPSRMGIRVVGNKVATATNFHIIGNNIDSDTSNTSDKTIGILLESSGWDISDNTIYGYSQAIR